MLEFEIKVEEFYASVIKKKIDNGDLARPERFKNVVLFYAGPSDSVITRLSSRGEKLDQGQIVPNWITAAKEALRHKAARIDDTELFQYLMHGGLRADLKQTFDNEQDDVRDATKLIWDMVSDEFAHSGIEKVYTLTCGASRTSSYHNKEMCGVLDGDCLKEANDKDASLLRAFRALGKRETQRVYCLTSLLELRHYARAQNDARVQGIYKLQRLYYFADQKKDKAQFAKLAPAEQAKRKSERNAALAFYQASKCSCA